MTRSIFDPSSGETERSGSQNLGPDANQISQMPPEVVDGQTEAQDDVIDMRPASAADGSMQTGDGSASNVGDRANSAKQSRTTAGQD